MRSKIIGHARDGGVILAITLALIVLIEGGVRIFSHEKVTTDFAQGDALAVKDPVLGHLNAPNVRATVTAPEYKVDYEMNAQGLRAPAAFAPRAEPGVARILLVGDSFTIGHGVALEEAWGSRLERGLNEAGVRAEVINAGVPGYGTAAAALRLERAIDEFHPDFAIMAFVAHDLFGNAPIVDGADGARVASAQSDVVKSIKKSKKSELHSLNALRRLLMQSDGTYTSLYEMTPRKIFFEETPSERFLAQAEVTKALFARAHRNAAAKNVGFAVVSFPQLYQVLLRRGGDEAGAEVAGRIDEVFAAFAEAEGFDWIETLPALTAEYESAKRVPYFRYDGHFNARGNAVVAEEILNAVKDDVAARAR
ncbi:MAG: SGNH/GDSL hydrolase family protein [Parvularculaceae bacterium]